MGTKRPFDEDLQEFIKHPKHIDYVNKPALFGDNIFSLDASQNVGIADEGEGEYIPIIPDPVHKGFEASAPLPLVTAISSSEEDHGLMPIFCSSLFPEFFEFNLPKRPLVRYNDTYPSLLNSSPRKPIPIGPDHQANVPDFDPAAARNYRSVGVGGVPTDFSTKEGESVDTHQTDCKCLDGGSIRCIQQHVNESRSKLQQSLGPEKFKSFGLYEMGDEVARKWTEGQERLFHEVVYANPISHGKTFWAELSIAFPSRTKKELVSYYFNVFILRQRAIQNRSKMEIDSDDDEWHGNEKGSYGFRPDDEDFVIGDQDSSSGEGEITHKDKVWESSYSMCPRKGVEFLPTCSMMEEIFGSSENGENTIQ